MPKPEPGFSTFAKSGFQIRFENGWTVSVQFSPMHYCGNRASDLREHDRATRAELLEFGSEFSCANAEVVVWDADGSEYHKFKDGNIVSGWTTPAELLTILNEIASKP